MYNKVTRACGSDSFNTPSSCTDSLPTTHTCGLLGCSSKPDNWWRKNSSLDYRWVCTICWYHLKVDSCSIKGPLSSEGQCWRKALLVGITPSSIYGCPPCLEWPEIWISNYSGTFIDHLDGWQGIGKNHDWKIGDKDVWGSGIWMVYKWAQTVNIFLSLVNTHHGASSSGDWSPKSKYPQIQYLVRTCFLVHKQLSFCCLHMA